MTLIAKYVFDKFKNIYHVVAPFIFINEKQKNFDIYKAFLLLWNMQCAFNGKMWECFMFHDDTQAKMTFQKF